MLLIMLEGSLKLPLAGRVFITRVEERAQLECKFMFITRMVPSRVTFKNTKFLENDKELAKKRLVFTK